mmetsp:Transcript_71173/g.159290  ORF Transcript_71173/g.159290 Transcript_71173/m.159290 type:complete len:336 (-) Transcript_71173:85-1092(-)
MAYRIFGTETSPYSVKVRSYFRYKGIPHEWVVRNLGTMAEYQKFAKLPIIPTVATPEGQGLQDSTPLMEALEAKHPEPSIHPPGPMLRFLSELFEEFGDEWGNKWMFHFRWAREVDQRAAASRIANELAAGSPEADQMADGIRGRMTGRGFAVGSNETTAPFIESNFAEAMSLMEAHLSRRPYMFGLRPALADFGIAAQVYQALMDPTAGNILRTTAPAVCAWVERMLNPKTEGNFEEWSELSATMEPMLKHVHLFLTWSAANAKAVRSGVSEMSVDLGGVRWWQTVGGPQRYHEKSLREIRRKYSACQGEQDLAGILQRCGCRELLLELVEAKL